MADEQPQGPLQSPPLRLLGAWAAVSAVGVATGFAAFWPGGGPAQDLRGVEAWLFYRVIWLVPSLAAALVGWLMWDGAGGWWRIALVWVVTMSAWMGAHRLTMEFSGFAPKPVDTWVGHGVPMTWFEALPQVLLASAAAVGASRYLFSVRKRAAWEVASLRSVASVGGLILLVAIAGYFNVSDAAAVLDRQTALELTTGESDALRAIMGVSLAASLGVVTGLLVMLARLGGGGRREGDA